MAAHVLLRVQTFEHVTIIQRFPAILRNAKYHINSYKCNPIAYSKITLLRCKPCQLRMNVQIDKTMKHIMVMHICVYILLIKYLLIFADQITLQLNTVIIPNVWALRAYSLDCLSHSRLQMNRTIICSVSSNDVCLCWNQPQLQRPLNATNVIQC